MFMVQSIFLASNQFPCQDHRRNDSAKGGTKMRASNPNLSDSTRDDNSRMTLERLLTEVHLAPERHDEIALEIERIFGQDRAVLVMDMSGFSRTTRQHGIISSLVMIQQVRLLALPCIEGNGGALVKADADNLFCLFAAVGDALKAAEDIVQSLDTANRNLPDWRQLRVSIGIGFGRILNVANEDLFGDEVNLASKLGEDVGQGNEILLTPAAHRSLPPGMIGIRQRHVEISGLRCAYFSVERASKTEAL